MDLELNCFNSKQHHLLLGSAALQRTRGGNKVRDLEMSGDRQVAGWEALCAEVQRLALCSLLSHRLVPGAVDLELHFPLYKTRLA